MTSSKDASAAGGRARINLVFILLVASVGIAAKGIRDRLWPWGLAESLSWENRPQYSLIDFENDSLRAEHGKVKKIYERLEQGQEHLMTGPETVVFGNDGTLFTLTDEGFLVSLSEFEEKDDGVTITAKSTVVADLGMGRPLGGRFDAQGTLYLADAHLGLTRLKNPGSGSKVELVASRVFDEGKWTQIMYANDVAIGPKTGIVYFTDSTEIAPDRIGTSSWDTMYGAKTDAIRGIRTGRLLQYDPSKNTVKVMARNLYFPNGIAVDPNESYLYFTETFTLRLLKYSLNTGELESIVDGGLTGYPDGVDCAWRGETAKTSSSYRCYAAMPSAFLPIMKLLLKIPPPIDAVFRSLIMALPKTLAPPVTPYGGIVEVDPVNGGIVRLLQDPTGKDAGMFTAVTVHGNKLYLGSLKNDYIGVYDLA